MQDFKEWTVTEEIYAECDYCGEAYIHISVEKRQVKQKGVLVFNKDGSPRIQKREIIKNYHDDRCRIEIEQRNEKKRIEIRMIEKKKEEEEKEKSLSESFFMEYGGGQILVSRIISVKQHQNGFRVMRDNGDVYSFPPGRYIYKTSRI